MIDPAGNGVELFLDGCLLIVAELEVAGLLAQADHFLRQLHAAFAALGPDLAQRHPDTQRTAALLHQFQLRLRICGKSVEGHHAGQAKDFRDVFHMLQQIGKSLLQRLQILCVQLVLGHTAVVFQGPDRSHHHDGRRRQAGHAALDVQKLLRAQVRAEARLGDGIVTELEGHPGGHDGVAAVGDVCKRPTVDEGGRTLQGLDQVGLQGVLEQGGHGALRLQVPGGDGTAVIGVAHHHPGQPLFHIQNAAGQAQHRHDLAGHSDVEPVLPGAAVGLAAQSVHDVAQLAVVHIHRPLPGDAPGIDAQGVALLNVVIQHGRQQVIGRSDGVEVAGEVKIDVLHRHHLGISAAGGAALDAEHRSHGWLPQGHHGVLADAAQRVRKAHGHRGLSLSGGGGIDGGHQNQLAVGAAALFEQAVIHLGLISSVQFQICLINSGGCGNFCNGLHLTSLCDFNVRKKLHGDLHPKIGNTFIAVSGKKLYHEFAQKERGFFETLRFYAKRSRPPCGMASARRSS